MKLLPMLIRGSSTKPRGAPATRVIEGVRLEDIVATGTLMQGWMRVRSNGGGPGGDGVTIEAFGRDIDVAIARLGEELLAGRYLPRQLRRAPIPKASGGQRWLSIPAIRDRVVQTATLIALTPTIEPKMSEASWAYRPGRGVSDALAAVQGAYKDGFVWTVDADITRYFDRVPHRRLIDELTIWIDDERIIRLFAQWLRGFGWRDRGIAQGSPISPLLANIYLHPIDRLIKAAGYPIVRYADDLLVLARSEVDARRALSLLQELLDARGLTVNSAKTAIRDPETSFRFLGQLIRASSHE
jgi:group II intron reverse transcriptase/maturase